MAKGITKRVEGSIQTKGGIGATLGDGSSVKGLLGKLFDKIKGRSQKKPNNAKPRRIQELVKSTKFRQEATPPIVLKSKALQENTATQNSKVKMTVIAGYEGPVSVFKDLFQKPSNEDRRPSLYRKTTANKTSVQNSQTLSRGLKL